MMKKLLSLFLGLGMLSSFAQSPVNKVPQPKSVRATLIEEFTNASCGPCAAQNPGLNNLINTNWNGE